MPVREPTNRFSAEATRPDSETALPLEHCQAVRRVPSSHSTAPSVQLVTPNPLTRPGPLNAL